MQLTKRRAYGVLTRLLARFWRVCKGADTVRASYSVSYPLKKRNILPLESRGCRDLFNKLAGNTGVSLLGQNYFNTHLITLNHMFRFYCIRHLQMAQIVCFSHTHRNSSLASVSTFSQSQPYSLTLSHCIVLLTCLSFGDFAFPSGWIQN